MFEQHEALSMSSISRGEQSFDSDRLCMSPLHCQVLPGLGDRLQIEGTYKAPQIQDHHISHPQGSALSASLPSVASFFFLHMSFLQLEASHQLQHSEPKKRHTSC